MTQPKQPVNPYLRLELDLVPADRLRGQLTPNLLRRVLGKALIDVYCAAGEPLCQPERRSGDFGKPPTEICSLAASCPYGVLYAHSLSARPPFALYVPERGPGQHSCELTLFGEAWRMAPWVVKGIQRACAYGLGSQRRRWRLVGLHRLRRDGRRERLAAPWLTSLSRIVEPDSIEVSPDLTAAEQALEVVLRSPTRFARGSRPLPPDAEIPFHMLVDRALDRFAGVYGESASPALQPEVRKLLCAKAADVPLLADRTHWQKVVDYSARAQMEISISGRVGPLIYGPGAALFRPILQAAEILHIGKRPTAGCGRIETRVLAG